MKKLNTGYPYIDKPWMKYYDESKVNIPFPKMTIYDYFKWMNKNHHELVATSFYGNNITYGEMIENIDHKVDIFWHQRLLKKHKNIK